MSILVLDSSFLISMMVEEEHTNFATETMALLAPAQLEAPALLAWEICNVLDKKVRRSQLSAADRHKLLGRLDDLPVLLHPPPDAVELRRVAALCEARGLTAYDGAYLDLALRRVAALATLDIQLARAARAEGLTVHCPF